MRRARKNKINHRGFTMIEVVVVDFPLEAWYHLNRNVV